MSGGRAPGKNVTWSKPQEPAFLKAFKDKVGYREPVTVDAKREVTKPTNDDEREDRDDELPTVVMLKSGDVSKEEFLEYRKTAKEKSGDPSDDVKESEFQEAGGRIKFKKPTKRKSTEEKVLDASTSKKSKSDEQQSKFVGSSRKKTKTKGIKNKSLLSFGGDDEEQ